MFVKHYKIKSSKSLGVMSRLEIRVWWHSLNPSKWVSSKFKPLKNIDRDER